MTGDLPRPDEWPRERVRLRRVRFASALRKGQDAGPLVLREGGYGVAAPFAPSERVDMHYPVAPAKGMTVSRWISRWALASSRRAFGIDLTLANMPVFAPLVPFLLLRAPNDGIRALLIMAALCLFASARRSKLRLQRNQTVAIHGRFWDQLLSSPPSPPDPDDPAEDRRTQAFRLQLALKGALSAVEDRSHSLAHMVLLVIVALLIAWHSGHVTVSQLAFVVASTTLVTAALHTLNARLKMQQAINKEHLSHLENRLITHMPLLRQLGQSAALLANLKSAQGQYLSRTAFARCVRSIIVMAPLYLTGGWLLANPMPLNEDTLGDLLLLLPGVYGAVGLGGGAARFFHGWRRVQAAASDMPPLQSSDSGGVIDDLSKIALNNIGFRHEQAPAALLRDVSLELQRGDVVALTGPSGSGKSTFLAILMGLTQPQTGTITLNDQPYPWNALSGYRARIAGVFQDTLIGFSTLRVAISLNAPQLNESDILQAAHDAGLDNAIAALPMGLETLLVEGGFPRSLMQQVLIAQALAQDPGLLILDETFSSLDMSTAQEIISAVRRRNITLVFATHRTELASLADRIMHFDGSAHNSYDGDDLHVEQNATIAG